MELEEYHVLELYSKILNKKKTEIVTKQSFNLFNQEAFLNDLSLTPVLISYIFDDPDDVYCLAYAIKSLMIMHLLLLTQSIILVKSS